MTEREQALAVAERFGWNLRRVRRREDLSQERLARRASLHRTEIGKLENITVTDPNNESLPGNVMEFLLKEAKWIDAK